MSSGEACVYLKIQRTHVIPISVVFPDLKNEGAAASHVLKRSVKHTALWCCTITVSWTELSVTLNLREVVQNVLFRGRHVDLPQDILVSRSSILRGVVVGFFPPWLGWGWGMSLLRSTLVFMPDFAAFVLASCLEKVLTTFIRTDDNCGQVPHHTFYLHTQNTANYWWDLDHRGSWVMVRTRVSWYYSLEVSGTSWDVYSQDLIGVARTPHVPLSIPAMSRVSQHKVKQGLRRRQCQVGPNGKQWDELCLPLASIVQGYPCSRGSEGAC